ncbi:MAG TPA: tetratricopeptide repeat protein [Bacteroidaceae bacterium]|nr:tetratricopeptide repeat protein [Bacteroidaceae bacterium]
MKQVIRIFSIALIAQLVLILNPQSVWAQKERTDQEPSPAGTYSKAMGDTAYEKGEFAQAITQYEGVLKYQGVSADVYYNLGNAYYKSEKLGMAILNYEKALKLTPADEDIKANLAMSNAKIVDKIEDVPQIFLKNWADDVIYSMNLSTWGILGVVFFVLAIASFCLYFWSREYNIRRVSFLLTFVFIVVAVVANLSAAHQKHYLLLQNHAIVLRPTVTVYSAPGTGSNEQFVLHEGSKVEIKDGSMSSWKEIQLLDGKVGWIEADAIGIY